MSLRCQRACFILLAWSFAAQNPAQSQTQPAVAATAPGGGLPRDPAQKLAAWREDLKTLATELPNRHIDPYFRIKPEEWQLAVSTLEARLDGLNDAQIALEFSRLVAMLGDSHTMLGVNPASFPMGVYPFVVRPFPDGVFVIAATKDHRDLLGSRIASIDGTPIDEVVSRVATLYPWENRSWRDNVLPRWLPVAEALRQTGAAKSAERISLEVVDRSGAKRMVDLQPLAAGVKVPFEWLPDPKQIAHPPISMQQRKETHWFEWLEDGRTLYVRYDQCADDPGRTVAGFGQRLITEIDGRAGKVDRVIIDLRRNAGGNSALLVPFIKTLKTRNAVSNKDHLFVLIGRSTFSSGMMNAIQLRDIARATLVGEPTGGKPNHHGEVKTFELPNSKLVVQYSTKRFITVTDDPQAVTPDMPVDLASADYFAGRDAVLDAVLARPAAASSAPASTAPESPANSPAARP